LNDYDLAFGRADEDAAVIRARLNVILLITLAAKKQEEVGQNGRETGERLNKRVSTENNAPYKSLHWSLGTSLSYPWIHENTPKMLRGRLSYCLWYGNHKKAETNMVVVVPQRGGNHLEGLNRAFCCLCKFGFPSSGCSCSVEWTLTCSFLVAMIMHARKKAGQTSILLYGIATDSWFWTFIRLDTQGKARYATESLISACSGATRH
jgi:hypothetical protein